MSIIKPSRKRFSQEEPNSLASLKKTCSILSHDNDFIDEILACFSINDDEQTMREPLMVGNVQQLLTDIAELDQQTNKIDVIINLKDPRAGALLYAYYQDVTKLPS